MLPRKRLSSIYALRHKLDKWLKYQQFRRKLFIGPGRCVLCRARADGICRYCIDDLPAWQYPHRLRIRGIDHIDVAFEYAYPVRELLVTAKYRADSTVMTALARLLPERIPNLATQAVIYPVPLSLFGLAVSGFNQAAILAGGLASRDQLPVDVVSVHKRNFCKRQSSLQATERRRNVERMFLLKRGPISRHAVIVDDIITTGATAAALARVLRRGGARKVSLVSLAAVR